jgi:hypothetical protein
MSVKPLAASSWPSQASSNMAWWAFQIQRGTPRSSVPLWASRSMCPPSSQ